MEDKLLKLLYDEHVITDEQYQQVIAECRHSSVSLETALEKLDILDEEGLLSFLSEKFRMPLVNWDAYQPDPDLFTIIPKHIASKYTIFPYAIERGKRQNKITLAIANPLNVAMIEDDISFMTGSIVKTEIASTRAILNAIQTYYAASGLPGEASESQTPQEKSLAVQPVTPCGIVEFDALLPDLLSSLEIEEEADVLAGLDRDHPSTKYLVELLELAVERGFSEIHIDPYGQEQRVRFCLHGMLHHHTVIPDHIGRGIVQRLRRIPRSSEFSSLKKEQLEWRGGFMTTSIQEKTLTVIFSIYPGITGEKIRLQIKQGMLPANIEALGVDANKSKVLERIFSKPQGLLLLVSPPKQGRTTTLHTFLQQFVTTEKVAISVEKMIESVLPKIIQIPLQPEMSFQDWYTLLSYHAPELLALEGLDSPLLEQLSVEFAAGSLVLTSFMASDFTDGLCAFLTHFCETCTKHREKRLLSLLDSLSGILSQRLVRTICPHCKEDVSPSESDLDLLHWLTSTNGSDELRSVYSGKGCHECLETGYAGRTGIFEIIKPDKGLKQFLLQSQPLSSFQVRDFLSEMSVDTMKYQAFQRIQQGITSVAEIRRVFFSREFKDIKP